MILQVINSLHIGGAEKFVVETAVRMHKTGHAVEVLILDRSDTPFLSVLRENGIRVRYGLGRSYLSPLNLITVVKILWSGRYEVIHTHLTYAQLWVAVGSLFGFRKVMLITTEHSNENNRRGNRWLRIIDKFIYSRYTKVISISRTVRDSLVGWIKPRDCSKYVVVPNCVDVVRFRNAMPVARYDLGLNDRPIVVMMVGRMSPAKDQITLLKAVEALPEKYVCVLVGDGETMEEVKKAVSIPDKVIFTGARTDVPELLKMCDVYVQSSHWEGMPTTVLEAMAAGKPVLGARVRGVVDIVPDEQQFEEGNYLQLADMIVGITPEKYDSIVVKQNEIINGYSLPNITNMILAIYKS